MDSTVWYLVIKALTTDFIVLVHGSESEDLRSDRRESTSIDDAADARSIGGS